VNLAFAVDARLTALAIFRVGPGSLQLSGKWRIAGSNVLRYYLLVIRTFRDHDAERLFRREKVRRLPSDIHRMALRKLLMLDAATSLNDLRVPPANRLEKLSGERQGQHSIRINDQWRVCFRWIGADAYDVEIVDYH
jgi:toxin HigB-1